MWFVTFSSLDRGSLAWKIVIINHKKTYCSQKKVELTSSPEKIRLLYTSPPHCSGFKAASLPLVCLLCNFYTFCFGTFIRNTNFWKHCTIITTITATATHIFNNLIPTVDNQPTNLLLWDRTATRDGCSEVELARLRGPAGFCKISWSNFIKSVIIFNKSKFPQDFLVWVHS